MVFYARCDDHVPRLRHVRHQNVNASRIQLFDGVLLKSVPC